jgi:hypothetical protein
MILEELGVISTAQDLLAGTAVGENVIDLGALAAKGFGPGNNNIFIDLECETPEADASGSSSTYTFNFIVDDTEALTSGVYTVLSVPCVHGDPRISAAGKKILSCSIPDQVWSLAKEGYRYFGLSSVLVDGNGTAGVSVNCAISPSQPRTEDGNQVTRSPVELPS